jgi:hypothetical protein
LSNTKLEGASVIGEFELLFTENFSCPKTTENEGSSIFNAVINRPRLVQDELDGEQEAIERLFDILKDESSFALFLTDENTSQNGHFSQNGISIPDEEYGYSIRYEVRGTGATDLRKIVTYQGMYFLEQKGSRNKIGIRLSMRVAANANGTFPETNSSVEKVDIECVELDTSATSEASINSWLSESLSQPHFGKNLYDEKAVSLPTSEQHQEIAPILLSALNTGIAAERFKPTASYSDFDLVLSESNASLAFNDLSVYFSHHTLFRTFLFDLETRFLALGSSYRPLIDNSPDIEWEYASHGKNSPTPAVGTQLVERWGKVTMTKTDTPGQNIGVVFHLAEAGIPKIYIRNFR